MAVEYLTGDVSDVKIKKKKSFFILVCEVSERCIVTTRGQVQITSTFVFSFFVEGGGSSFHFWWIADVLLMRYLLY